MSLNTTIFIPATFVLGILLGLVGSDIAQFTGFPHASYELTLEYTGTPESDFVCTRIGQSVGGNASNYDFDKKHQQDCVINALGAPNADGSFSAVRYSQSWHGRLFTGNDPIRIPSKMIKEMVPQQFSLRGWLRGVNIL